MLPQHKHLSTAALGVAGLALFVSLGGGSVAAGLLTGADIKNGSITGKDIKKKTVTGKHVKDKSLTGADLKDGTVKAADLAAGTLEPRMTSVRVSATSGATADEARAAAPEKVLYTEGPFTIYAKCYTDASNTDTTAAIYVRSTVGGAILAAGRDYFSGGAAATDFLTPLTDEDDREIELRNAGTGSTNYWRSLFSLHAPDGTAVSGLATLGAKNGTLAGGNGVYGAGDACVFSHSTRSN
jgi:hypothetical protein